MGLEYSAAVRAAKSQVLVELTQHQLDLGVGVGHQRNALHRNHGRADGIVRSGTSLEMDIDGALAELAVCVAFNEPWANAFVPQITDWDARRKALHDVGSMEVKSTKYAGGCLLVQPQFSDESPYVLVVTNLSPVFRIAGWLYGWEVKQPQFWRVDVPRPCFMAPQSALRPVNTL